MSDGATIHIIDDDPSVRKSVASLAAIEGHVCHTYFSAQAFLDAIDNDATGCVVTDVRMRGMSGLDLLAIMKERRVSMPVIVITAHADVPLAVAAMKQERSISSRSRSTAPLCSRPFARRWRGKKANPGMTPKHK